MDILVTGGRDFDCAATVAHTLALAAPTGPHTLIHGACKVIDIHGRPYVLAPGEPPGADRLAHHIALAYGWQVHPHPADWPRYGKAAGPRRNQDMAQRGANVLLAFPGGSGTRNMITCAQRAGIRVHRIARIPTPGQV